MRQLRLPRSHLLAVLPSFGNHVLNLTGWIRGSLYRRPTGTGMCQAMGIFVSTIYFYFLISIFGDYNDTGTRWKAFAIVLAGGIVQAICLLKFPQQIGALGTLLLSTGTMVLLLVIWCRIALLSALKIVGAFLAGCVAVTLLIQALAS